MPQLIKRRWSLVLSISLVLVCLLTACTTTPPNTNETTPPTLTWTVHNGTAGTFQTYKGSSNPVIHATQGTQYFITLRADDLGGIKQITLGFSTEWTCSEDGVAQSASSLGVEQVANFSPDSNGNVLTSQFMLNEDTVNFTCNSGFKFDSGADGFSGTSTNFSNKVAKSTLAFAAP